MNLGESVLRISGKARDKDRLISFASVGIKELKKQGYKVRVTDISVPAGNSQQQTQDSTLIFQVVYFR